MCHKNGNKSSRSKSELWYQALIFSVSGWAHFVGIKLKQQVFSSCSLPNSGMLDTRHSIVAGKRYLHIYLFQWLYSLAKLKVKAWHFSEFQFHRMKGGWMYSWRWWQHNRFKQKNIYKGTENKNKCLELLFQTLSVLAAAVTGNVFSPRSRTSRQQRHVVLPS